MAEQSQRRTVGAGEKRDHERKPRRVMVRYGTRLTDKTAFTRNISATGMFLQTNGVLNPGSTIQVHLQFPDREFTMWARVRWAKKTPGQLSAVMAAGMGVQFIEPPDEWIEYFRKFLV